MPRLHTWQTWSCFGTFGFGNDNVLPNRYVLVTVAVAAVEVADSCLRGFCFKHWKRYECFVAHTEQYV